jgi:hypothetical protein
MNVILVDGFYDAQDLKLIGGIKDRVWYAKPRGGKNPPIPNIYILQQWNINDDYEEFVEVTSQRIHQDYGPTVVLTPKRNQTFSLPTVQLQHPARYAQLLNLGIAVHI